MNLVELLGTLSAAMNNPFAIHWTEYSARCLLFFTMGYGIVALTVASSRKNHRRGAEHGSAQWGDVFQIAKRYRDKKHPKENLILTQHFQMGLDGHKHKRNTNVLVIGGSGAGKSRSYAIPNALNCGNCSMVICDPKSEILRKTGGALKANGYEVRVFDLLSPDTSFCYNPLAYVRDDKDVLRLIETLIQSTTPPGAQSSDPFWTKSETALLQALVLYLMHEAPKEEQNFAMVMEMLAAAEVREEDEEYESPLDILFARLEMRDPESIAVKQYHIFKMGAGKTLKSILISCGARLAPFDIAELREIMSDDELELDTLGDRKTALFLIMSDTDTTFNFVIAMLQSQLFNLLCDKADDVYGGRLPVHVRCLLDEFANIGQIPNFDKLIATIRSREISASIILQSQSQLKTIYKDAADTIVGNCDSTLFLGGKEKSTLKEISELLGKETIDSFNQSENRGSQVSHGLNYQKLGKELMTQDEIAVMDGGKCILQLRGVRPFFSDKFDIMKHPRYKYLADADKKNTFDIERYMKRRPAIVKPDEPFDLYELKATDLQPNNSTERKEM